MKRWLPLAAVALLGGILAWTLLFWNPAAKQDAHQLLGVAAQPAGGDFTLQSRDGQVSLASLRGKVVALYFGYTWCPDICPTSLGYLTVALNELTPAELSRVQGLFVSVDPARDTPERLDEYGKYFHPRILGITGTPRQLRSMAEMYGAAFSVARQDSATGYVVDHTAELYIIDREGRLRRTLPHGTSPAEVLAALREYL